MLHPMTSRDIHSVISSLVSVDGAMPCVSRDGPTKDLFGQEAAPASRIARRGRVKVNLTKGICGLLGMGSSASAALQKSLESKLAERLPMDGLMKSSMIWKVKITPLRQRYCQLVLSKRLMKENAFSLWHTLRTLMIDETPEKFQKRMGDRSGTTYPHLLAQLKYPMLSTSDAKGSSAKRFRGSPESHNNLRENLRTSTEDGQYVHPNFARWMMGYSLEHLKFAPTETLSSRK